jgi:hypothetical protein
VADTVYGNNLDLRTWLEKHGYKYVLAVANKEEVRVTTADGPKIMTVKEAGQLLIAPQDWQRKSPANWHKRTPLLRLGLRAHLTSMAK